MIKTCPICHKEFETDDKRRKYCGHLCALEGKRQRTTIQMRGYRKTQREEAERSWALYEADKLWNLCRTNTLDYISDYVYNNYRKKGK